MGEQVGGAAGTESRSNSVAGVRRTLLSLCVLFVCFDFFDGEGVDQAEGGGVGGEVAGVGGEEHVYAAGLGGSGKGGDFLGPVRRRCRR